MSTYGGVDISRDWLDAACWPEPASARFPNDAAGVAAAAAWFGARGVCAVSVEATGGYEVALWRGLESAGIPCRRENPRRVHQFAQSLGRLAKTDALDADVIARYAAQPRRGQRDQRHQAEAPDPHLASAAARRRQLVEMLTWRRNSSGSSRTTRRTGSGRGCCRA